MVTNQAGQTRYAICVNNAGYPASLELRKLYEIIDDPESGAEGLIRVIDESGEDYLYPSSCFYPLEVTSELQAVLRHAS